MFLFYFIFLQYAGLSLLWSLPLRSTGSGRAGPAATAHGPSRSAARRILPNRGTNPHPLHPQADSQPLHHQGSPWRVFFNVVKVINLSFIEPGFWDIARKPFPTPRLKTNPPMFSCIISLFTLRLMKFLMAWTDATVNINYIRNKTGCSVWCQIYKN